MNENFYDSDGDLGENPLEDIAAELSKGLESDHVGLFEGSTDRVEGGQVFLQQSGARSVQASALRMDQSGAGTVRADVVDVQEGAIGVAFARDMTLCDVNSTLLVGRRVEANGVQTVALFAGRVDGDVKTILTPLIAFAIGTGFGVAYWFLRRVFSRQQKHSA